MNEKQALDGFAAIAQETRLRIIPMLVTAGADGMAAGAITQALRIASVPRVSFHLNHLEHAGPVESRREGRSIISRSFPHSPISSPFACE
jgi:ArsR family transcriptional regulator, arsenate/arsenite/antimonite-responsive transcriptional repressor